MGRDAGRGAPVTPGLDVARGYPGRSGTLFDRLRGAAGSVPTRGGRDRSASSMPHSMRHLSQERNAAPG